jgi:uncharacterized protein (DUF4213/DUF364 family)
MACLWASRLIGNFWRVIQPVQERGEMMNLVSMLLDTLPADPIPVRKIVIGVHWTLVASKSCGLASSLVGEGPHGHSQVRDVGTLHQKSAQELAGWALSDNLLEASIGVAALNSLLEVDETRLEQINASEVIARESMDKNLVVIGHFPFIERIKTIARNCWVIEKHPYGDEFPAETAQELIPQANVVAITGTAFTNHTIDTLISLCRPGSLVMVLGPSTPLSPLLFDHGISFLSGTRVVNEDAAVTTIQQGAIFPQVKGTRLVTMTKEA